MRLVLSMHGGRDAEGVQRSPPTHSICPHGVGAKALLLLVPVVKEEKSLVLPWAREV